MGPVLRKHLRSTVNRLADYSLIISILLYISGVVLSCSIWNVPMAQQISIDTNDLSPGPFKSDIIYTLEAFNYNDNSQQLQHGRWRQLQGRSIEDSKLIIQNEILSQRSDQSQRILIIAIGKNRNQQENRIVKEVVKSLQQLNPKYLSKHVTLVEACNTSIAAGFALDYIHRYGEQTIASFILNEQSEHYGPEDVVFDILGPTMARPNMDLVAVSLKNCKLQGLDCKVISDKHFKHSKDIDGTHPVHWIFNDHSIASLSVIFKCSTEYKADTSWRTLNTFEKRRTFKRIVQSYIDLVQADIRCINNLNEPLHDSSFLYLVSPYKTRIGVQYEHHHYTESEQLFVKPMGMLLGFICFPLSLFICSLPLISDEQMECDCIESTFITKGSLITLKSFIYGHFVFPWLATSALPHWITSVNTGFLSTILYMLLVFLLLDILLVGRWPKQMCMWLCQACAVYLVGLAFDNYLHSVQLSYVIVPLMIAAADYANDHRQGVVSFNMTSCVAIVALVGFCIVIDSINDNIYDSGIIHLIRQPSYNVFHYPTNDKATVPFMLLLSGLLAHTILWLVRQ